MQNSKGRYVENMSVFIYICVYIYYRKKTSRHEQCACLPAILNNVIYLELRMNVSDILFPLSHENSKWAPESNVVQ
jgi:hypothetical protein